MASDRTSASARTNRADGLVDLYERAGYLRVEPAILQPADDFLELAGEELRSSLFITSDARGRELCLRPDLTIPVCRGHLEQGAPGRPAAYCYLGPVFRDRGDGSAESLQAGIGRSAAPIARPPMPNASRWRWTACASTAPPIPKSAWATSACSRRWSPRSTCRPPGNAA
jgi:hypothetical protein